MGNALSTPTSSGIETRPTLSPASQRDVYAALEPMLMAYLTNAKQFRETYGDKALVLYVNAVAGEPLWAVNQAVQNIVLGVAPGVNRNFIPKVPAFAEEVRRQSATMRDRQERQDKIANEQRRLDAEYEADLAAKRSPLSPEARERLDAFIGKAARGM